MGFKSLEWIVSTTRRLNSSWTSNHSLKLKFFRDTNLPSRLQLEEPQELYFQTSSVNIQSKKIRGSSTREKPYRFKSTSTQLIKSPKHKIIIREDPLFENSAPASAFDLLEKELPPWSSVYHDGKSNSWGSHGKDGEKNKSSNESCQGAISRDCCLTSNAGSWNCWVKLNSSYESWW